MAAAIAAAPIWLGHVARRDAASGVAAPRDVALRHAAQEAPGGSSPEARAVRYLAAEVPRWRREHACYSCHNNGDGSRALFAGKLRGYDVGTALDETLTWLNRPDDWAGNASEGGFDDKGLAHIQFALSLDAAIEAGLAQRTTLRRAAALVAASQQPDGSWRLNSAQNLGTPVTYGTALATWASRRVIRNARAPEFDGVIARADAWLRAAMPENIVDSAAVALALSDASDPAGLAARARALAVLEQGQAPDGGWGPYTTAASEPFDTSIAMLAIQAQAPTPYRETSLAAARRFLLERQLPDGSWPETTRPSGGESYAQRISTTAWATLALLGARP
jgi:hypothetical protein